MVATDKFEIVVDGFLAMAIEKTAYVVIPIEGISFAVVATGSATKVVVF